ncbi:mitochondrial metalloendopeptidase [Schizosaccharomyces pombe]|uniref:Presequence protease, mitochondrial n=1 Tax=Schizosaccharomyces pombe (strain 972 / ATCC 24843) TaxID=284812 RepID=PREP_SCHPO|nr:putative metalloendopeptidase [Schizosaccharomyces pombe]CAA17932.4 mitochondrial metalloendopeptidase (predicted) [Schizosaccharomyces pombe]|eukprot:NP_595299.2 putative metalloendopeptidase [Schizosaccharomyces pombe]
MNYAKLSIAFSKKTIKTHNCRLFQRWLHVGDKVHDFRVVDTKKVPELQLNYTRLKHEPTNADMIHLDREDPNSVFSIGFQTPAENDEGIPHILEHTTLCGSNKYPVRDPFFKMLNRSLATFMNAFTASDFTFYPFATVNTTDYKNLRDVYLDATLFPKLRKLDFLQEGWRFEHADVNDKKSPIIFNGVVYNEMKGQVSDSSYIFYMLFQQHLFQGTAYGFNSGGDPLAIPDLKYEELVKFHRSHYHPSNAKILSYGSFPLEDNLSALSETFRPFSKRELNLPNTFLKEFDQEKRVVEYGPLDPVMAPGRQVKTSISFLANDTSNVYETFALKVLSKLCFDGFSSPFYKALIESGLGTDFAPNSGYDSTTKRGIFSVGLEGASEESLAKIENLVYSIFNDLALKGFENEKLEAILHQMEISLKHKSAHFGIGLAQSLPFNWFNGADPADWLSFNKQIEWLKQKNSDGKLFQKLIKKYILENKSRFVFTMLPSSTFPQRLQEAEAKKLQERTSKLTDEDIAEIEKTSVKLLEAQSTPADTSCLPTLSVSDIPETIDETKLKFLDIAGMKAQWYDLAAGLTYIRLLLPLKNFPESLIPYLPVYCDACLNLGTHSESIGDLEHQIRRYTGGISISPSAVTNNSDVSKYELGIAISGYALDKNVGKLVELINKAFWNTNLSNTDKLAIMLKTSVSGITDGIAEKGHSFAKVSSASGLTEKTSITEQLGGLTQVKLLSQLSREESFGPLVEKLTAIREILRGTSGFKAAINASPTQHEVVEKALQKFMKSRGVNQQTQTKSTSKERNGINSIKTYHELPFQTYFAAKSCLGVPYTHPDGAPLQILSSLLTHKYLHGEIREKGGAYGAGLSYSGIDGVLSFFTYRDSDPIRSLSVFDEASEWATTHEFSQRDIDEAKLAVFQGIDSPVSESQKGMLYFVDGVTDEMLQNRRKQLLNVSANDLKAVAKKYLVNPKKSYTAVLGPKSEKQLPTWVIDKFES